MSQNESRPNMYFDEKAQRWIGNEDVLKAFDDIDDSNHTTSNDESNNQLRLRSAAPVDDDMDLDWGDQSDTVEEASVSPRKGGGAAVDESDDVPRSPEPGSQPPVQPDFNSLMQYVRPYTRPAKQTTSADLGGMQGVKSPRRPAKLAENHYGSMIFNTHDNKWYHRNGDEENLLLLDRSTTDGVSLLERSHHRNDHSVSHANFSASTDDSIEMQERDDRISSGRFEHFHPRNQLSQIDGSVSSTHSDDHDHDHSNPVDSEGDEHANSNSGQWNSLKIHEFLQTTQSISPTIRRPATLRQTPTVRFASDLHRPPVTSVFSPSQPLHSVNPEASSTPVQTANVLTSPKRIYTPASQTLHSNENNTSPMAYTSTQVQRTVDSSSPDGAITRISHRIPPTALPKTQRLQELAHLFAIDAAAASASAAAAAPTTTTTSSNTNAAVPSIQRPWEADMDVEEEVEWPSNTEDEDAGSGSPRNYTGSVVVRGDLPSSVVQDENEGYGTAVIRDDEEVKQLTETPFLASSLKSMFGGGNAAAPRGPTATADAPHLRALFDNAPVASPKPRSDTLRRAPANVPAASVRRTEHVTAAIPAGAFRSPARLKLQQQQQARYTQEKPVNLGQESLDSVSSFSYSSPNKSRSSHDTSLILPVHRSPQKQDASTSISLPAPARSTVLQSPPRTTHDAATSMSFPRPRPMLQDAAVATSGSLLDSADVPEPALIVRHPVAVRLSKSVDTRGSAPSPAAAAVAQSRLKKSDEFEEDNETDDRDVGLADMSVVVDATLEVLTKQQDTQRCLDLSERGATTVVGLGAHSNTEVLMLQGNALTIDAIRRLNFPPYLRWLSLERNQLTTLSRSIKSLQHLRVLNISQNQISTMPSLASCENLTELYASGNRLSSYDFIAENRELLTVDLKDNHYRSLQHFPALPQLRTLNLSNNEIDVFAHLEGLQRLSELILSGNIIHNIQLEASLTSLRTLYLADNSLDSLFGMRFFPSLRILVVDSNILSDFTGWHSLVNIISLSCKNNKICSRVPLRNLTKLEKLDLTKNEMDTLEPFHFCPRLQELVLDENHLGKDLFDVDPSLAEEAGQIGFSLLSSLSVCHNEINDVFFITKLPRLQTLIARHNVIADGEALLTCISQCRSLRELDIRENPLSNYIATSTRVTDRWRSAISHQSGGRITMLDGTALVAVVDSVPKAGPRVIIPADIDVSMDERHIATSNRPPVSLYSTAKRDDFLFGGQRSRHATMPTSFDQQQQQQQQEQQQYQPPLTSRSSYRPYTQPLSTFEPFKSARSSQALGRPQLNEFADDHSFESADESYQQPPQSQSTAFWIGPEPASDAPALPPKLRHRYESMAAVRRHAERRSDTVGATGPSSTALHPFAKSEPIQPSRPMITDEMRRDRQQPVTKPRGHVDVLKFLTRFSLRLSSNGGSRMATSTHLASLPQTSPEMAAIRSLIGWENVRSPLDYVCLGASKVFNQQLLQRFLEIDGGNNSIQDNVQLVFYTNALPLLSEIAKRGFQACASEGEPIVFSTSLALADNRCMLSDPQNHHHHHLAASGERHQWRAMLALVKLGRSTYFRGHVDEFFNNLPSMIAHYLRGGYDSIVVPSAISDPMHAYKTSDIVVPLSVNRTLPCYIFDYSFQVKK